MTLYNIAIVDPLPWTKRPSELKIEKKTPLNNIFSYTNESILKQFYRNVLWVTLYQNC